jgi:hypothetical protein
MAYSMLQGGQGDGSATPYSGSLTKTVVVEFDLAEALSTKGSALATGDVFEFLYLPKDHIIHGAVTKVTAVTESTGATFDLDVAGGDDFVDGGDLTTLGYVAPGTNGLYPFGANTEGPTASGDTLDLTIKTVGGTAISTGTVQVHVFMTDVSNRGPATTATRDFLA